MDTMRGINALHLIVIENWVIEPLSGGLWTMSTDQGREY